jgi:hypothetical protein
MNPIVSSNPVSIRNHVTIFTRRHSVQNICRDSSVGIRADDEMSEAININL